MNLEHTSKIHLTSLHSKISSLANYLALIYNLQKGEADVRTFEYSEESYIFFLRNTQLKLYCRIV